MADGIVQGQCQTMKIYDDEDPDDPPMKCLCGYKGNDFIEGEGHFHLLEDWDGMGGMGHYHHFQACPKCGTMKIEPPDYKIHY